MAEWKVGDIAVYTGKSLYVGYGSPVEIKNILMLDVIGASPKTIGVAVIGAPLNGVYYFSPSKLRRPNRLERILYG